MTVKHHFTTGSVPHPQESEPCSASFSSPFHPTPGQLSATDSGNKPRIDGEHP